MEDSDRYPGASVLRAPRQAADNLPAAMFSFAFWCALTGAILGLDVLVDLLTAGF